MRLKHSNSIVILCLTLFSGCSTTQSWLKSDILLDPTQPDAKALLAKCSADDYVGSDLYVFINGKSATMLRKELTPVSGNSQISKRYCGTGFMDQPEFIEGAARNVFLSDRNLLGLVDVEVLNEKNGANTSCFLIKGTASEL